MTTCAPPVRRRSNNSLSWCVSPSVPSKSCRSCPVCDQLLQLITGTAADLDGLCLWAAEHYVFLYSKKTEIAKVICSLLNIFSFLDLVRTRTSLTLHPVWILLPLHPVNGCTWMCEFCIDSYHSKPNHIVITCKLSRNWHLEDHSLRLSTDLKGTQHTA